MNRAKDWVSIIWERPITKDEKLITAQKLCKIYFDIAAEAIGEDEVRRRRDQILVVGYFENE